MAKKVVKRKAKPQAEKAQPPKSRRLQAMDEEILSSDDDGDQENGAAASDDDEEEEDPYAHETPDEKKIRLAKQLIARMRRTRKGAADDGEQTNEQEEEEDEEGMTSRLKQHALEVSGRLFRPLAEQLRGGVGLEDARLLRGHKTPVTCVTVSTDGSTAYSGSKDCCIIKWDLATCTRTVWKGSRSKQETGGHTHEVLSVAVSSDGHYLASGGRDKLLRLWDTRAGQLIDSFRGHRDIITSVSFAQDSHQLITGSFDRTLKIWNVAERSYMESLFGHQEGVTNVDYLGENFAVSTSEDRTVRFWKIAEETQLVFKAHGAQTDAACLLNENNFVSTGADGSLCLWSTLKKKPLCTVPQAHGGQWLTSLCAVPHSDLVFSGASDGSIRCWKCDLESKTMTETQQIPVAGFVNGLCLSSNGRQLVAAIGQEHRLGRWSRIKEARNGVYVVPLPLDLSSIV